LSRFATRTLAAAAMGLAVVAVGSTSPAPAAPPTTGIIEGVVRLVAADDIQIV
jgi:hypothetical protein